MQQLLHPVGLTFIYYSKMHGHSNIKFTEYCMRLNMTAIAFPRQQNSHFSLSCMRATDAFYANLK